MPRTKRSKRVIPSISVEEINQLQKKLEKLENRQIKGSDISKEEIDLIQELIENELRKSIKLERIRNN